MTSPRPPWTAIAWPDIVPGGAKGVEVRNGFPFGFIAGVAVCVIYDVETKVRGQEIGCRTSIAHVERYVIQLLYLHVPSFRDDQLAWKIPRAPPLRG